MINREAKSSIVFRHWIKANPQFTGSYEMKDTRGKDYFNISEVTEAQINYALAINSDKGVLMRVQALNAGMPDYVYLRNEPAWIVIKYPKFIAVIDINVLLTVKSGPNKSIVSNHAKMLSEHIIPLGKKLK